ncbi:MAG: flagellar motor switch protein FliG [Gammaproteobacteria bacterium]
MADNGPARAAILLLSLGESEAAAVLRHMDVNQAEVLGGAMRELDSIGQEQLESALSSLEERLDEEANVQAGSEAYIRNVLNNAFGNTRASALLDRIFAGDASDSLEALAWMSTDDVFDMVRLEHPQVIAIVMAYLAGDRAAQVMARLESDIQADVLFRIANLTDVQQSALKELEDLVARQSDLAVEAKVEKIGGEKVAAAILNAMPSDAEESVTEQFEKRDAELLARIQELMFVFENLMAVDDRGIQSLLREVSSDDLALSLKGADAKMQDKIYRNMSKRAAQMMAEDLEARGPVKLADVEAAQRNILEVARRMSEAGDIVLSSGGSDYV